MSQTLTTPRAQFESDVQPFANAVSDHPLWSSLRTTAALRIFMEHHVCCVWDFMILLKRLQRDFTGQAIPWQPRGSAKSRRLINEIVTGEESDQLPNGETFSHYELYLQAMDQVGANTAPIEQFRRSFTQLPNIEEIRDAALVSGVPQVAAEFVGYTCEQANGSLRGVVAAFAIGREEVIPAMFQETLRGMQGAEIGCERFVTYLDRHIELDGDTHGPMAMELLESLCETEDNWREVTVSAIGALKARKRLWDGIWNAIGHI